MQTIDGCSLELCVAILSFSGVIWQNLYSNTILSLNSLPWRPTQLYLREGRGEGWAIYKKRHYYSSLQLTYLFKTPTKHKKNCEGLHSVRLSCVVILTVLHLVASRHLNVSRFLIQHNYCHCTIRKYHAVQLNAPSAHDKPKWFNPHIGYILAYVLAYWRTYWRSYYILAHE